MDDGLCKHELFARTRAMMRDHDGGGNLQRAWHRDEIEHGARILQHTLGAAQQRVGDVFVVACLDHEDARAFDACLAALRLPARACHSACLHQAGCVARHHIHFKIERVTELQRAERGDRERMRNDEY